MKKKAEVEIILDEERGLAKVNEELQVKFSDIKREIKYMKGLMREFYQAKGLLDWSISISIIFSEYEMMIYVSNFFFRSTV